MKKIMIAAAIVCAAVVSHAATYNWSVTFAASPDDENPLVGTVYAFDANMYALSTISASLAKDGTGLTSALGHGAIDADGIAFIKGTGLTDNGGDPLSASMYAIIVSEGSDGKDYFYAVNNFAVAEITDAVTSGGAVFSLDYVGTGAIGSSSWTEVGSDEQSGAVPEPTSGLLLLLGVAGLALKRKCA